MNKFKFVKNGISLYLLFFIMCCIPVCGYSNAEELSGDKQQSPLIDTIWNAMEASYRMDYKHAEELFDETIEKWPDDPMPYLFKGGLYLNMFEKVSNESEEEIERIKAQILYLNNKAIEFARIRISGNPDDENARYSLGGATGNIGRYYILNGRYMKAFWKGKKGFKILKRIVDKDDDYHDAYLGLGLYNYFSATMPKIVKVLSFILGGSTGDKEKGISQLELVRDNSKLLSVEARKILLRVYRGEDDFNAFYHNSKWLAEHYPENLYFQIPYIYGLTHNKQFEDAQNKLTAVNAMLKNDLTALSTNIRVKYYRYAGLLNYKLGNYEESKKSYMNALELVGDTFPPTRLWSEDYYYLAASNAILENEKEAFKYLRKAIVKGWQADKLDKLPEWLPYKHNNEFLMLIGK